MEFLLLLTTAFWLGILTSISPCPLATNIAAVSFVSYRVRHRGVVLLSWILYTVGRSLTYAALGFLVVRALVNIPLLSDFLQRYINRILGPLLILVGIYLLGWFRSGWIKTIRTGWNKPGWFNTGWLKWERLKPGWLRSGRFKMRMPGLTISERTQKRLDEAGLVGSLLMGVLFALAFCPVAAALFFGSLIPLAVRARSDLGLPFIYGVGTGLPVLLFAGLVAAGSKYLDKVYRGFSKAEYFTRIATGVILIVVGLYYIFSYILGMI